MLVETIASTLTENPFLYLMKNYADYNLWANYRIVNWLRRKPQNLLEQEVPSSFPGIRQTLIHIWQTEQYWFSLLRTNEPEVSDEFTGDMEELFDRLIDLSSDLADYVNSFTKEDIFERTSIVSPWFQSCFPNFEYLMHCFNHSTYHRGQLVTIGRNLGFTDAPMTDYNYYNVNGK